MYLVNYLIVLFSGCSALPTLRGLKLKNGWVKDAMDYDMKAVKPT